MTLRSSIILQRSQIQDLKLNRGSLFWCVELRGGCVVTVTINSGQLCNVETDQSEFPRPAQYQLPCFAPPVPRSCTFHSQPYFLNNPSRR